MVSAEDAFFPWILPLPHVRVGAVGRGVWGG